MHTSSLKYDQESLQALGSSDGIAIKAEELTDVKDLEEKAMVAKAHPKSKNYVPKSSQVERLKN